MRIIGALILALCPFGAFAQDWEDRQVFGKDGAGTTLRVLSSTDTAFFEPVIAGFLDQNADAAVEYLVTSTADLDVLYRNAPQDYDVVISSAMDLQLKLANDGLSKRLDGIDHPQWAQWRQTLFAFTSEPAAIVVNRAAFAGHSIPETRQELIQALRARPEVFRGRVGTYDVRRSGLGYLFATQDARASETFWRLMEVMGSLDAQLYCCSGDMIDDLSSGKIAVAYNVLGSYAEARQDAGDVFEIILPADFPTTMMRTALVSDQAPNPVMAAVFVQHLLQFVASEQAQHSRLPPLLSGAGGDGASQSTIVLEPALMTYLDALKRRMFLKEWESAIIQTE